MLRRNMLSTTAILSASAVLAACTPSPAGTLPAQLLTDVSGALMQLKIIIPAVASVMTTAIPAVLEATLLTDVGYATQFLGTISSSTPVQTGVTVLARIEGYGGAALAALLGVPLPPPYSLIAVAANVIWGSLEVYINSLIPPPVTPVPVPSPAAMRAQGKPPMTVEEARKILKIGAAQ